VQLELAFWPRDCVRQVLHDYLDMKADTVTGETQEHDYAYRVEWLCEMLGPLTPAASVTYPAIEAAARKARGTVKDVTIKRRISFWLAAARYAALREVIDGSRIPEEPPPWLRNDSVHCDDFYTLEQYREFRLALPPGRFRRRADLSMFTGMHTYDLDRTTRKMLDPDYEWPSGIKGRWWRRCNKNASEAKKTRIKPCWVPMEPELREFSGEWLAEPGHADSLISYRLNNMHRTFEAAALRAGLPVIRANLGFRSSHANLLLARDWRPSYVRIVLGHAGEVTTEMVDGLVRARVAKRPTTLEVNYLRNSPDIMQP